MTVKDRLHVHGKLHPVKISNVTKNERVYEKNERVCIFGDWDQGRMVLVYVGAFNVGSIKLNFDKELRTNSKLPNN